MFNGQKLPQPEVDLQLAEANAAADRQGATMNGFLQAAGAPRLKGARWKADVMQVMLRVMCMAASLTALSFMVTAKQHSFLVIYDFQFPVHAKWYLVGVLGAVAIHSCLQLLVGISRLLRKSPAITPSRNYAWLLFAGDQALAYALMSAGSAASGVANLNRTGIRHTALPNFCRPLRSFCDHVTVSIAFTFLSCILLATSVVLDVVGLAKH
ncbi:CASP-like protein 3A1 isoform X2 [Rhodamnia argentea]|uniref:CASP-like protein n=1 Tax=Rhodamnia argentea TaxID=178133 RepID=A0A8B8NSP3_9MYRT|nr:CASP-like protein 3A1 isoform X2 [Rhodamnia argentea]